MNSFAYGPGILSVPPGTYRQASRCPLRAQNLKFLHRGSEEQRHQSQTKLRFKSTIHEQVRIEIPKPNIKSRWQTIINVEHNRLEAASQKIITPFSI